MLEEREWGNGPMVAGRVDAEHTCISHVIMIGPWYRTWFGPPGHDLNPTLSVGLRLKPCGSLLTMYGVQLTPLTRVHSVNILT